MSSMRQRKRAQKKPRHIPFRYRVAGMNRWLGNEQIRRLGRHVRRRFIRKAVITDRRYLRKRVLLPRTRPHLAQYRLDGRKPIRVVNLFRWASHCGRQWTIGHPVDKTTVGDHEISTIFLGLDHNFWCKGPPLLFETMVLNRASGMPADGWPRPRYPTWKAAQDGHDAMVELVRSGRRFVAQIATLNDHHDNEGING